MLLISIGISSFGSRGSIGMYSIDDPSKKSSETSSSNESASSSHCGSHGIPPIMFPVHDSLASLDMPSKLFEVRVISNSNPMFRLDSICSIGWKTLILLLFHVLPVPDSGEEAPFPNREWATIWQSSLAS